MTDSGSFLIFESFKFRWNHLNHLNRSQTPLTNNPVKISKLIYQKASLNKIFHYKTTLAVLCCLKLFKTKKVFFLIRIFDKYWQEAVKFLMKTYFLKRRLLKRSWLPQILQPSLHYLIHLKFFNIRFFSLRLLSLKEIFW